VLDKAKYSAFESTLNSSIVSYRIVSYGITWRHRSRDRWIPHRLFPIGGPSEPSLYL